MNTNNKVVKQKYLNLKLPGTEARNKDTVQTPKPGTPTVIKTNKTCNRFKYNF